MTHLLFFLVGLAALAHLVAGSSTTSSCPPSDGTSRSVWSILGSCGLTLLICVWHALHPDVPKLGRKWPELALKRAAFVMSSFFAPEIVVAISGEEWCKAHRKVKEFRQKGYELSMTHSHFVRMYGFVYRDEKGSSRMISADEFLQLCKDGKIADPLVTQTQIKDKSKSDAVGKVIFALQLIWFGLQVVVRGSQGLAITLVELDTVCMAVLALVYLFFCGDNKVYSPRELSNAWSSQPSFLDAFIVGLLCIRKAPSIADKENLPPGDSYISKPGKLVAMIEDLDMNYVTYCALFASWIILGGLHLVAWNFEFPTDTERMIWRIASLVLAGSSPLLGAAIILAAVSEKWDMEWIGGIAALIGILVCISAIASRALLVGLMLASLRALPCSAHDTVSWTVYIPHL